MSESSIAADTQDKNLNRVRGGIAALILDFASERIRKGASVFHLAELAESVSATKKVSPESAGRILRDLRKSGDLDYELLSRSESKYRFVQVRRDASEGQGRPFLSEGWDGYAWHVVAECETFADAERSIIAASRAKSKFKRYRITRP